MWTVQDRGLQKTQKAEKQRGMSENKVVTKDDDTNVMTGGWGKSSGAHRCTSKVLNVSNMERLKDEGRGLSLEVQQKFSNGKENKESQ